MKRMVTKFICMSLVFFVFAAECMTVYAMNPEPELTAPSYVLMEESTGKIICAKNETERRSPASITKIMTLILAFDALESGKITLEEEVMTSAYAKSMGGSQVFLEEGELQTVDTLLKCIAVASGNDASVALAEHIAGSEEAFVKKMNEKAAVLGLADTFFEDCSGLTDSKGHYSSALDVAKMSQYLIRTYPKIYEYTGVWMEEIVHKTIKGESIFTLSSTNKLLKQYPYTTGLKTGSTDAAGYCISATAKNADISLIAVVMGAESTAARFDEAKSLLHYGFGVSRFYQDTTEITQKELPVQGAIEKWIPIEKESSFRYLDTVGIDFDKIEKKEVYVEQLEAPVAKGSSVGEVRYFCEGKDLGSIKIIASKDVLKAGYPDFFLWLFRNMLL